MCPIITNVNLTLAPCPSQAVHSIATNPPYEVSLLVLLGWTSLRSANPMGLSDVPPQRVRPAERLATQRARYFQQGLVVGGGEVALEVVALVETFAAVRASVAVHAATWQAARVHLQWRTHLGVSIWLVTSQWSENKTRLKCSEFGLFWSHKLGMMETTKSRDEQDLAYHRDKSEFIIGKLPICNHRFVEF